MTVSVTAPLRPDTLTAEDNQANVLSGVKRSIEPGFSLFSIRCLRLNTCWRILKGNITNDVNENNCNLVMVFSSGN